MYVGFKVKLLFFFTQNQKKILFLCQSKEHLQNTFLTKLLGPFFELHQTQF